MSNENIIQFSGGGSSPFDAFRLFRHDGAEYWSARSLMLPLGYERWENMAEVCERARIACANAGQSISDHLRDGTKMIQAGKGAKRKVQDFFLTRYGAYLVAMNGDPRKPEISAAQTYFAVKTREAETASPMPALPATYKEALLALVKAEEAKEAQATTIKALEPKAAFCDRVADLTDCQNVNEVAKVLGTGEGRLWKFLKENKIVFQNGRSNAAYQEYIDRGYFRQVQRTYRDANNEEHAYTRLLVTGKGLIWLQRKWDEAQAVKA